MSEQEQTLGDLWVARLKARLIDEVAARELAEAKTTVLAAANEQLGKELAELRNQVEDAVAAPKMPAIKPGRHTPPKKAANDTPGMGDPDYRPDGNTD